VETPTAAAASRVLLQPSACSSGVVSVEAEAAAASKLRDAPHARSRCLAAHAPG
jgi:hypothetical protein